MVGIVGMEGTWATEGAKRFTEEERIAALPEAGTMVAS